jgi:predicted PhzF superfamily epimerase YddE/YHI9
MKIPIYQVDAFADAVFQGNPAAVCPLETWPEESLMQSIAAENNLSETAFLVPRDEHYELRWFTPKSEVDLCGHATLAAAFVVFHFLDIHLSQVDFKTPGDWVTVRRDGSLLPMDFTPCEVPDDLVRGLGAAPVEVLKSRDYLAVFPSEEAVRSLTPDLTLLERLDALGVIVTAPGKSADFVSRFFAPREGIPEDPVTGSAHCTLIPYWAAKLGKKDFRALQVSERGGVLTCEDLGERVRIAGEAVMYMEGIIAV